MTIFKAFLKILQKNLATILISTAMLLIFGGFTMSADNNTGEFVDDKPDITIINHDQADADNDITAGLIKYLEEKADIVDLPDDEDILNDALFYRETNLIIYIPENYSEEFLQGDNPKITYRSSGDYQAAFAEMILARYLEVAEIYRHEYKDVRQITELIGKSLEVNIDTELTSHPDTASLSRAARFFNFESYALLNSLVFIIAMIMTVFNSPRVYRRLLVSSTSPSRQNRILLIANFGFAGVLWLLYLILGWIVLGSESIFSLQGIWWIFSSFLFMLCATAIAFLVGTLVQNKNAINGIVNVVALGSSFLCGAFVPQMWLPDSVLAFAHVLPTYYYIDANELIAEMESMSNNDDIGRILFNFGMMIGFTVLFVVLTVMLPKLLRRVKRD